MKSVESWCRCYKLADVNERNEWFRFSSTLTLKSNRAKLIRTKRKTNQITIERFILNIFCVMHVLRFCDFKLGHGISEESGV
jgi:hypothetical protein